LLPLRAAGSLGRGLRQEVAGAIHRATLESHSAFRRCGRAVVAKAATASRGFLSNQKQISKIRRNVRFWCLGQCSKKVRFHRCFMCCAPVSTIQRFLTVRMRTQLDNGEAKAKVAEKSACAFTEHSHTPMN